MQVIQSTKLANVCYEIRGPVLEEAMRLEAAGHRILKLNTGNPAAFGFECPPEILEDMLRNLGDAHGYGDAKGLLAARRAVMMHYQTQGVETDVENVFIGNGVSELIVMAMQGLLDDGDEVLVPAPDYPCGRPRSPSPAARPCTTAATSSPTGCPISPTWSGRSPTAPRRS